MKFGVMSMGSNTSEAAQVGRIAIRLIGEVLDRNHSPHSAHGFVASYKTGPECRLVVRVGGIAKEEREIVYQIQDTLRVFGSSLSFTANFS
jgi:hypothetical protein